MRQARKPFLVASGSDCARDQARRAGGGSEFKHSTNRHDSALGGDLAHGSPDRRDRPIARLEINVADVDLESHSLGDAVDRAGVNAANTRRGHGVRAAAGTRRAFDLEHR